MRRLFKVALAGIFGIAMTGWAAGLALADGHTAGYVKHQIEDLQWNEAVPGAVWFAPLWGDLQTGPSAVMLKIAGGNPGGMHWHTSAYHATMIAGANKHWIKGQDESEADIFELGDYWYQPADQVHQDANPGTEDAIIFLYFPGTFDVHFEGQ